MMIRPSLRPDDARSLTTSASDWGKAAAILSIFMVGAYLPMHSIRTIPEGILAGLALLLLVGLLVSVPWLIHSAVVGRIPGKTAPLGLDAPSGTHERRRLSPRRQVAAVMLPALASTLGIIVFARGAIEADSVSMIHAASGLGLATGLVVVAWSLTPLPTFGGWDVLLALAAIRGVPSEDRIGWAAGMARLLALLVLALLLAVGLATSDPWLLPLAVAAAWFLWSRTGRIRRLDVAGRFFRGRTAAELGRPLTMFRRADGRLSDVASTNRGEVALVVDDRGAIVGAVGARQVAAPPEGAGGATCWAEAMVPIRSLALVPGAESAGALLPGLARDGFAIIRLPRGLAAADAEDVERALRAWRHTLATGDPADDQQAALLGG